MPARPTPSLLAAGIDVVMVGVGVAAFTRSQHSHGGGWGGEREIGGDHNKKVNEWL